MTQLSVLYESMNVREAIKEDIQEWLRMRTELWPDTNDQHLSEIETYFNDKAGNAVQVYVIENRDRNLIGFIELFVRNYAEGSVSRKVPYIEGWYIDSKFQNRGYGKLLEQKAEQWAKAHGYSELASDANIDNHQSIAIHKKLGFKETGRNVCFLKKLI